MLGGPQSLTFFDTYAVDGTALWAKLVIIGITAVTVGLSLEWFRADARHGEYYTLLLLSALGAVLLAGAADLMELILAALLSSATGFVLTAYHRRSKAYNRTNTPPPSKTSSGTTSPNGIRISGGIRA